MRPEYALPRKMPNWTKMISEEMIMAGMQSPYGKAAAYAGLAFITPISGYVCYLAGGWLNGKLGTSYLDMVGMLIGCALGMYEAYRQAVRIEGLDRKPPK